MGVERLDARCRAARCPWTRIFACSSGSLPASAMAWLSVSSTSLRRLARRQHAVPGGVFVIDALRQRGRDCDRLGASAPSPPTASAVSRPSCSSGSTNASGTNEAWMRPPSRSAMMVALTVYGTCTRSMPVLQREIGAGEMGRGADAGGAVVDRRRALTLASATNSLRLDTPSDGGTTTIAGRFADQRHAGEIADRIERQVLVDRAEDGVAGIGEQQRVAVGRRVRDRLRRRSVPPAPARLATTTCWPKRFDSLSA